MMRCICPIYSKVSRSQRYIRSGSRESFEGPMTICSTSKYRMFSVSQSGTRGYFISMSSTRDGTFRDGTFSTLVEKFGPNAMQSLFQERAKARNERYKSESLEYIWGERPIQ